MKIQKYFGAAIMLLLFALICPLVHAITTAPDTQACLSLAPEVVLQTPSSAPQQDWPFMVTEQVSDKVAVEHESSQSYVNNADESSFAFTGALDLSPPPDWVSCPVAPHLDDHASKRLPHQTVALSRRHATHDVNIGASCAAPTSTEGRQCPTLSV